MTKSVKYIIAIIFLLGINLWLFFSEGKLKTTKNETYFDEVDIEKTSKFIFIKEEDTVKIEKTSKNRWIINERYNVAPQFINTLISILKKVEVKRKLKKWNASTLGTVEVVGTNATYKFQYASNSTETKSYFITEGIAKEVTVAGYRDLVIDLFRLHADQWRDRLIFDGDTKSIRTIKVMLESDEDFYITNQNNSFKINEKSPKDSLKLIKYLNQFRQFQANEMISYGRFPRLDSLAKTKPLAIIQIDDEKYTKKINFVIYQSLLGQQYHLVKVSDTLKMVIDVRRIKKIVNNPNINN